MGIDEARTGMDVGIFVRDSRTLRDFISADVYYLY